MHFDVTRGGRCLARAIRATALCSVAFSVWDAAAAQQSPRTGLDARISLSGELPIQRLVDLSAERLGFTAHYDKSTLTGTVTLRTNGDVSGEELWALTNEILLARGFTSVRGTEDRGVSIVKVAAARDLALLRLDQDEETLAGWVALVYRVQHGQVADLVTALQAALGKDGSTVSTVGSTNLVVLSGPRSRVRAALALLDRLDTTNARSTIVRVEAVHLPATQLASLVTAAVTARAGGPAAPTGKLHPVPDGSAVIIVAPASELPIWKHLIREFDIREVVLTRSYVPEHFSVEAVARLIEQSARDLGPRGSGDQWRLVVNELTGTLIVTATSSEHERVDELIERLNSAPLEARRPVRTYPIRNRGVNEVLDVITQLMETGVFEGGSFDARLGTPRLDRRQQSRREVLPSIPGSAPETSDSTAASGLAAPGRAADGKLPLTLTADKGTNTLIAMGEARLLDQLEQLLKTIDIRQPQVMLEVLVIALTDDETFDLGVELQKLEVSGETLISLSSLFGLSGIGVADSALPRPGGVGGTGIILRPADFSIVIRALETVNEGRTLTMPKMLVNSNQTATLDSVLQEPFVSTNASDTVATTSFGGTQDAGTTVTVVPQIAEGDHLVLEYSVSLSSFVGESGDPAIPPPRQQNNLQSVVTIPDGYTVVVGGLEVETDADAESRVPLLGSIPILGEAFKSRSKSKTRTRFYVFIRPTILRHPGFEDLKYLSDQDLMSVDIDDGWPKVEPRVIR